MRRTPLVIAAMTSAMALTSAPALASDYYHHDRNHLEPGCFMPDANGHYGHWGDVDLDSHLTFVKKDDYDRDKYGDRHGSLREELHVTVDEDAPFSVDQVLVAGVPSGYTIYNVFPTGTISNDEDIDPGQTATDLTGPTRFIDNGRVIVCVSDHDDAYQNEPYDQEGHGKPIFAKDRPILKPHVTAFGVSAIENLNTYRIGFGYEVERWYTGKHRKDISAVSILPRADSSVFDARGVNDVDKPGEAWASLFNDADESDASGGQTFLFRSTGDMTAWADTSLAGYDLDREGRYLYTNLTQGDLPMSWTLRVPLASPSSKRSATFTLADFFAWKASWQAYLCDGAPMPTLPLAPGTNSPKANCPDPVHVSVTLPAPTPANPTPTPVVVNPTPVTVNSPAAPAGIGAGALANALAEAGDDCTSRRVIKFTWVKGSTNTKLRYRGKTVKGKMSNGRMRATADFRGYQASRGDLLKVAVLSRRGGRAIHVQRVFKAC